MIFHQKGHESLASLLAGQDLKLGLFAFPLLPEASLLAQCQNLLTLSLQHYVSEFLPQPEDMRNK